MADILGLEAMLNKTKLTIDDMDKLVEETRAAVVEADNIYIRAKHNREKATSNYTRALALRTQFIERSTR